MKNINKRKMRNDIILIAAILLIAVLSAALLMLFSGEGEKVEVSVNGEPYAEYSLSDEIDEVIITGEDKAQKNRLIIKDGKAYVESATCPDGICSAHAPISRNGESIVCLPHRVVITVTGKENGNEADIVA